MVNSASLRSWKKDVVFCFSYNVAQAIDTLYYHEGKSNCGCSLFVLEICPPKRSWITNQLPPFPSKTAKEKRQTIKKNEIINI